MNFTIYCIGFQTLVTILPALPITKETNGMLLCVKTRTYASFTPGSLLWPKQSHFLVYDCEDQGYRSAWLDHRPQLAVHQALS